MEMRNWVTPEVTVQGFDADEYVAACFKLSCEHGKNNNTYLPTGYDAYTLWGDYVNGGKSGQYTVETTHSTSGSGTCVDSDANSVVVDGTNVTIKEHNAIQGWLAGEVTFTKDINGNGLGVGDLFAWITHGLTNGQQDERIWLHWAYAGEEVVGKPNHS